MNNLADFATWAEIITQAVIGFGTILLSIVLWRSTTRHEKAEFSRAMHEKWMSANLAMAQDEKLAKICDEILFPNAKNPNPEDGYYHRKRYLIFLHLNIMEADFKGYKAGLISKDLFDEALDDLMKPMFKNAMPLIKEGGYGKEFMAYCEKRNADLWAEGAQPPLNATEADI